MNVAIVGCGLIGQKRAKALSGARLVACADSNLARAEQLARNAEGCVAASDWRQAVNRKDVSAVVIATPHDSLAEITAGAIEAGKHVLVEKPAARHVGELRSLPDRADQKGVLVHVGFNHRYHRAFRQARQIVDSGALGPLMFLRARYGHGGRIGYDKEWRAQPELSGGGELIDQGVHIIDLARWFLGDFTEVEGYAHTYFWNMPVDDNAFLLLKTAQKQVAFLHASCTEWKNTFSFELYGHNGKLQIDGLGGSYGVERLAYYKMLPEMGPPETTIWEYPMADNSWEVEMAEFLEDIRLGRQPAAGLKDAVAAMDVVDRIYRESGYDHCA
ncbi:MAG: Gfo/Idh/MocA family oxidoreductase [Burkholderiales bacterium]|nr:Gfo/Idh/MocA family oxidoreductase [Burkholderiales bacterium]MBY0577373.1 Gfo/Idh/MocA family oxidoreductase [Gallionellaceae bacterium]